MNVSRIVSLHVQCDVTPEAEMISAKKRNRKLKKRSSGLYLVRSGGTYLFQIRLPKRIGGGAGSRPVRIRKPGKWPMRLPRWRVPCSGRSRREWRARKDLILRTCGTALSTRISCGDTFSCWPISERWVSSRRLASHGMTCSGPRLPTRRGMVSESGKAEARCSHAAS